MIVETSSNQFFKVRETGNPELAHVWVGIEVKKARDDSWMVKKHARDRLVRKAATRVVEA